MKKRVILYGGLILLLVGLYFVLMQVFPKSVTYYPVFIFLVGFEVFLWDSLRKGLSRLRALLRYLFTLLYWAPFIILAGYLILTLFIEQQEMISRTASYLLGVAFVVYISKLIPVIFLLINDIIRLFRFAVTRLILLIRKEKPVLHRRIARFRFLQAAGLSLGAVLLLLFVTGITFWVTDYKVREYQLELPALPAPFKGFRIVQFSDVHTGSWASDRSMKKVVGIINDLHPDMIFFTGDMVNNITKEAYTYESFFKEIKAPYGVFAILGNHDYGDYITWDSPEAKAKNFDDLITMYRRIGWRLLRNENVIIGGEEGRIAIIGVENWGNYGRFPKRADMKKALEGVDSVAIKLLLSHDPTYWQYIVTKEYPDIDVTFSGHTHGFQFAIDTRNVEWSPLDFLYTYWIGMYTVQTPDNRRQILYINRGLGNIGFPGRVGVRPEITLFELR
jgi:predicted MPP superfamily phosphohydrolase